MVDIANSSTGYIALQLFLTGTATEATGKTVAITISKNGAAFGNPSAGATNATEIGNGWYYYAPSATDTGTNGILIVRGTAASCDNTTALHHVVPATNGRLTALPATAVTTNGSLLTAGTGTSQIDTDGSGRVNLGKALGTAVTLDANNVLNVSTKYVAGTAQTAGDIPAMITVVDDFLDTEITSILGYVQNLPSDPADASVVAGLIAGLNNLSSADVSAAVWNAATATYGSAGSYGLLIETNLDGTITSRASQTSVDDLPTNAELATALGTADDAVLTQVALVKAKTDQLTFTVAGQVDANAESMNGTAILGNGTAGNLWRG